MSIRHTATVGRSVFGRDNIRHRHHRAGSGRHGSAVFGMILMEYRACRDPRDCFAFGINGSAVGFGGVGNKCRSLRGQACLSRYEDRSSADSRVIGGKDRLADGHRRDRITHRQRTSVLRAVACKGRVGDCCGNLLADVHGTARQSRIACKDTVAHGQRTAVKGVKPAAKLACLISRYRHTDHGDGRGIAARDGTAVLGGILQLGDLLGVGTQGTQNTVLALCRLELQVGFTVIEDTACPARAVTRRDNGGHVNGTARIKSHGSAVDRAVVGQGDLTQIGCRGSSRGIKGSAVALGAVAVKDQPLTVQRSVIDEDSSASVLSRVSVQLGIGHLSNACRDLVLGVQIDGSAVVCCVVLEGRKHLSQGSTVIHKDSAPVSGCRIVMEERAVGNDLTVDRIKGSARACRVREQLRLIVKGHTAALARIERTADGRVVIDKVCLADGNTGIGAGIKHTALGRIVFLRIHTDHRQSSRVNIGYTAAVGGGIFIICGSRYFHGRSAVQREGTAVFCRVSDKAGKSVRGYGHILGCADSAAVARGSVVLEQTVLNRHRSVIRGVKSAAIFGCLVIGKDHTCQMDGGIVSSRNGTAVDRRVFQLLDHLCLFGQNTKDADISLGSQNVQGRLAVVKDTAVFGRLVTGGNHGGHRNGTARVLRHGTAVMRRIVGKDHIGKLSVSRCTGGIHGTSAIARHGRGVLIKGHAVCRQDTAVEEDSSASLRAILCQTRGHGLGRAQGHGRVAVIDRTAQGRRILFKRNTVDLQNTCGIMGDGTAVGGSVVLQDGIGHLHRAGGEIDRAAVGIGAVFQEGRAAHGQRSVVIHAQSTAATLGMILLKG